MGSLVSEENTRLHVTSPLGLLRLEADDMGLCALSFVEKGRKTRRKKKPLDESLLEETHPLREVEFWLDGYFTGSRPSGRSLPIHFHGTAFQIKVWKALLSIPYGRLITYGELGALIRCNSAQAIGQAVGKNPIPIIVPCHRVVGKDFRLGGFSGGIERKIRLLALEGWRLAEGEDVSFESRIERHL